MATPARRLPQRTCVACRTARAKSELVRIVRTPAGEVVIDPTGRLNGRGAYLCADGSCWSGALKKSSVQRALGVPLPTTLQHTLEAGLRASAEGGSRGA